MQCLPFLSETRREAFSMFPKRKKFQWFRILGMFSVLWHAQHTRVHRNSQKNESIHCNYICKKNFARGWLLRDFTLERVKDWWCVKDWSLTVAHTVSAYALRRLSIVRFEQVVGSIPRLCSCNNCIRSGRAPLFFANLIYGGYNWITTNRTDGWNPAAICIITSSVLLATGCNAHMSLGCYNRW